MTSQELAAAATAMPRCLVRRLRKASSEEVWFDQSMGFTYVEFRTTNSDAFAAFSDWRDSLAEEADPYLTIVCRVGMPAAEADEAWAILQHYATLTAANFVAAPASGPPLPPVATFAAAVRQPVKYHHSPMALSKVMHRIGNPNDAGYPNIAALAPGTEICTVQWTWGKGHITVEPVFRA